MTKQRLLRVGLVILVVTGLGLFIIKVLHPENWAWDVIAVSLPLWLLIILVPVVAWLISKNRPQGLLDQENRDPKPIDIDLNDVGGLKAVKEIVSPIVAWLKIGEQSGTNNMPRGILFVGPPGVGKSLLAEAIAGQAKLPLYYYAGSEMSGILIGYGALKIRRAFEIARNLSETKRTKCIVLFEHIDLIAQQRTNVPIFSSAASDEAQTIGQLLKELDDPANLNVFVMATTSRPRMLDAALTIPGRLSLRIDIGIPELEDREAILDYHATKHNLKINGTDLQQIAAANDDFTGAELAQMVKDAVAFAKVRLGLETTAPKQEIEATLEDFRKAKAQLFPPFDRKLPQAIFEQLNAHVVGQEDAKKWLAVAVSNHYLRLDGARQLKRPPIGIKKSNVLIIGPTGTGKTLLIETIAEYLKIPYVIFNSTVLTETGYSGATVEQILYKLLLEADLSLRKAEYGIVCIDEFDKLAFDQGQRSRHGGASVQQELLKIVEGTVVDVPKSGSSRQNDQFDYYYFNTKNILFICLGAFVGIENIIAKRVGTSRNNVSSKYNLIDQVQPQDIINFGFIPELIGRFPVTTYTRPLNTNQLVEILKNEKNGLRREYQTLLEWQGWHDPEIRDDALKLIATKARSRKVGARGLRAIMEEVLLDTIFEFDKSEHENGQSRPLIIDEAFVRNILGSETTRHSQLLEIEPQDAISRIIEELDSRVAGNSVAKKELAVISLNHYLRYSSEINADAKAKSTNGKSESAKTDIARNLAILLIDPFLRQRNQLVQALSEVWEVPFVRVTADALERALNVRTGQGLTWFIEPIQTLLQNANYDLPRAEHGIVFIDDFDRNLAKVTVNQMYSPLSAQIGSLIKGEKIALQSSAVDDTEFQTGHLLFVFGGDFRFAHNNMVSSGDDTFLEEKYQSENLLSNLKTDFEISSELLEHLLIVLMDFKLSLDALENVIKQEQTSLINKYQDLFTFNDINFPNSPDFIQELIAEAADSNWRISDIRHRLESDIITHLKKQV